jgi:hypothetical protein
MSRLNVYVTVHDDEVCLGDALVVLCRNGRVFAHRTTNYHGRCSFQLYPDQARYEIWALKKDRYSLPKTFLAGNNGDSRHLTLKISNWDPRPW